VEIDITNFVQANNCAEFSASAAELGHNAGRITWDNAKREAAESPMLTTAEQFDALRHFMRDFGAWDKTEIDGWDETECNALFIQLVSGDWREIENLCCDDNGNVNWETVEELQQQGTINSYIFRADDDTIFYSLDP
jgi:hypothetical protein